MSDNRDDPRVDEVSIRRLILQDMEAVIEIERDVYDQPWDEDDFAVVLRKHNCTGEVAEQSDQIVGFVVYETHLHGIKIRSLTVDDPERGMEIGTKFIQRLKKKILSSKRHGSRRGELSMVLHEESLSAQLFLSAHGFRAVDIRRDYYDDGEDAYLLSWSEEPDISIPAFRWANRIASYL